MIGAGGIGAPVALALARAGVQALEVIDDDVVEVSNLHRQILFEDEDVGTDKLDAFVRGLGRRHPAVKLTPVRGRAVPATARALIRGATVVIDATDNFATRFLLADAAHLEGIPIVHAAAVRWHATVMAVAPAGAPCYRCLFEDLPQGPVIDCATAGVMGPLCGIAGAVAADRALRIVAGDPTAVGHVVTFDGQADRLRQVKVGARRDCPLCGEGATIGSIEPTRYMGGSCDPLVS